MGQASVLEQCAQSCQNPKKPNRCRETALAPRILDAALLAPTSPRKVPEWLVALKDALAAKCCVGDASGERGAAQ